MRIGIIAMNHESNTFISTPTTLDDFRRESLLTGDAIVERWESAAHEIGGFLAGVRRAGAELVPILAAWAMPGGTVTGDTYQTLLTMIQNELAKAPTLDGLLVAPHGAGVSEEHLDMDGHWLSAVREQMGPDLPIISTLDPHVNLSQRMIDACNATIAYRSNPHLDQRDVGLQAADLMFRTLNGEVRPTQAACLPPIAVNIERQSTTVAPCLPMYEFADAMLQRSKVLSNSICLGFSFADVPDMGSAFIVVTDNDHSLAQEYADELGAYLTEHRSDFVANLIGMDEAINQAMQAEKPVCLLDMGDNVGGGSPGDSTHLAHALEKHKIAGAFVCLYDPESVQQADRAGAGQRVQLRMGGKTDDLHGKPLECEVTVRSLHDGDYTEPEVRHGGRNWGTLGRTAIVETDGGLTIQLTSVRNAPFSIQPIRCCGLDPTSFQILVAKGVIAPVAAYQEVCPTLIRVNTPGCTSADFSSFTYKHRRRPLYPFES
jgi:microcystin degradation protein MlrC